LRPLSFQKTSVSPDKQSILLENIMKRTSIFLVVFCTALILTGTSSPAQTFTNVYTFAGPDGSTPTAGLFRDSAGNLYGTTFYGGTFGFGTVFKLDPSNHETVLYNFAGGSDGANPYGGLIRDSAGNFYGTTSAGGSPVCQCGTVFKLSSSNKKTVLYRFRGGTDGAIPWSGLIRDSQGNLYGTTSSGGTNNYGTVFKLSSSGKESVLHRFQAGSDGSAPLAGVIRDSAGNLYGTASGASGGSGVLFKIDASNHYSVQYELDINHYGLPESDLIFCYTSGICGTQYMCEGGAVWEFTKSGEYKVLYSPADYYAGCWLAGAVVQDKAGNLFGTASGGGGGDAGTLFEVFAAGGGKTIYTFGTSPDDGFYPQGDLVLDKQGNLYGITPNGGNGGYGTIWKFAP
jgi:uncharacterized repeat protein (TIGR03803 family)